VVFDGPDAAKINCANMGAQLITEIDSKKQPNFTQGFGSNCNKTGPGSFELSWPIPDNQATGEYELKGISANVMVGKGSQVTFSYSAPDVPALKFKIDNPNGVTKPTIKSVTALPKA
jgi:hypothetical protein